MILDNKQPPFQTKQEQKLNFFEHNIELNPVSSVILCGNNILTVTSIKRRCRILYLQLKVSNSRSFEGLIPIGVWSIILFLVNKFMKHFKRSY